MQGFGGAGGTAPPSPYGPSATVPPRPDNIHIFRRCLRAELNRLSPQAPRKHRKKGRMGFSPCGRYAGRRALDGPRRLESPTLLVGRNEGHKLDISAPRFYSPPAPRPLGDVAGLLTFRSNKPIIEVPGRVASCPNTELSIRSGALW